MAPPQVAGAEAGSCSMVVMATGLFLSHLLTPSQEAPGGRHRFAAGTASVGGVTGLLASRLRY